MWHLVELPALLEHLLTRPYFVGWGTLALINAGLAQGKRRSGLLWFLVSLFLGPLATLLIVITDPGTGVNLVPASGRLFGIVQLPWHKRDQAAH